jgi:hypothetical protein
MPLSIAHRLGLGAPSIFCFMHFLVRPPEQAENVIFSVTRPFPSQGRVDIANRAERRNSGQSRRVCQMWTWPLLRLWRANRSWDFQNAKPTGKLCPSGRRSCARPNRRTNRSASTTVRADRIRHGTAKRQKPVRFFDFPRLLLPNRLSYRPGSKA